jgi:hypothetical protein
VPARPRFAIGNISLKDEFSQVGWLPATLQDLQDPAVVTDLAAQANGICAWSANVYAPLHVAEVRDWRFVASIFGKFIFN